MSLTKFDRIMLKPFAEEARHLLETLAKKHGIQVSYSGGNFTDSNFQCKFDFKIITDSGAPADFDVKASLIGKPNIKYGRIFNLGGEMYRVIDIRTSRPKYPIVAERISDLKRVALTAVMF